MEAQVLQLTREELEKHTEVVVKTLNDEFDKKIETKMSDLDTKLEDFRKTLESREKINPDYQTGKMIYDLIKGKALDPQDETTAADGGYLVPDVTAAEILRLMEEYGQARQYMRTFPMGKAKTVNIPKKLTGLTVSRVGENAAIPDTKATLGTIQLSASKAGLIVAMSSELDEDSIVDLGAYINELVAEAFGTEEDSQYFNGSGSPFTGIFSGSHTFGNSVSVTSVSAIDYDDLVNCARGIKQSYLRGASWFMHRTVYAVIEGLKDSTGRPLFVNAGDPLRTTLFGFPVVLVESAPDSSTSTSGKPVIALGNLRNSIIGVKRELTVKVLTEATVDGVNLAENDLIGLRVTKRDAFNAGLTSAYSVIKIA